MKALPSGASRHAVPQKGIKNGTMIDATHRNVSQELQIIMSGASSPLPVRN
jgi:hypothetical protein